MKHRHNIEHTLRQAALDFGLNQMQLSNATGLERTSLARFMRGETSMRLDKAALLADYLGLELRPVKRNKKGV